MMVTACSSAENELLRVAINLFNQSDDYAATELHLARQYARQAYQLGLYSRRIRQLIVQERIQMIRRQSTLGVSRYAEEKDGQTSFRMSSKTTAYHLHYERLAHHGSVIRRKFFGGHSLTAWRSAWIGMMTAAALRSLVSMRQRNTI